MAYKGMQLHSMQACCHMTLVNLYIHVREGNDSAVLPIGCTKQS